MSHPSKFPILSNLNVLKHKINIFIHKIVLKFSRHLCSITAEVPTKTENHTTTVITAITIQNL